MSRRPVSHARAARAVALPLLCVLAATGPPADLHAQGVATVTDTSWASDPPDLENLVDFARAESELRGVFAAYDEGHSALFPRRERGEPAAEPPSPQVQRAFYRSWLDELSGLDFDALNVEGKVDYVLLRNLVQFELRMLDQGIDTRGRGDGPVGREVLQAHLEREMVPYTPEEVLAIADREWEWMAEARADATRRMGYGDDWRAALEEVKQSAPPPGTMPGVVTELLRQSLDHIDDHGTLTIPSHLREIWRMSMKSAERQVGGAFFNGGLTIHVPWGTEEQSYERRMMSMRGNNPHFSRATVHHELMPGHGLQYWASARFNPHRSRLFSTPFWMEGWALYHEFVLWDQGFPRGPEDELGMLFWRMHRSARIKWIISYHLGLMTPEEGVEYLVNDLGFERANAEAEVGWGARAEPLYQAAYMLGGLQLQALRRELVDSGRMGEREFHDTFILGGRMPMEANRLRMTGEGLSRDYTSRWRFYGDPLGQPAERRVRTLGAEGADGRAPAPAAGGAPSLQPLLEAAAGESDLRVATRRFEEDLKNLRERYDVPYSPVLLERERVFFDGWLEQIESLDPSGLNAAGRAEHRELRSRVLEELVDLDARARLAEAWAPLLPFARTIQLLQERMRDHLEVDAPGSARMLDEARRDAVRLTEMLDGGPGRPAELAGVDRETAMAAVGHLDTLRQNLETWYTFYYLFDPDFTWWMRVPYEDLTAALDDFESAVRGEWSGS